MSNSARITTGDVLVESLDNLDEYFVLQANNADAANRKFIAGSAQQMMSYTWGRIWWLLR